MKTLNETWLNGKYSIGEINTSLPYLSVGDFFVQGEDAQGFIDEIYNIWVSSDITTEQAFIKWASIYSLI